MHTIDLQFQGIPGAIAAFLLPTAEGPVLVETGPYSTLDTLRRGIAAAGYAPAAIRHVLLTHIHFDHAGAAWWFARQGATVYVHPQGLPHLLAPQKLWQSAARIYGDAMETLWGQMEPIAADRLRALADREQISIGDMNIIAHHTPGHAVHHIAWEWEDQLFTGDVAGVRIGNGPVVPPCPPPDIQLADWKASLSRLRERQPRALHLTHFGTVDQPLAHLEALEQRLQTYADWMRPYAEADAEVSEVLPRFNEFVRKDLEAAGLSAEDWPAYEAANPPWMSVSGLLRYWRKYGNL